MTNYDALLENITPAKMAQIMMCPSEFGGETTTCPDRGKKCGKCKLRWLNTEMDGGEAKQAKHKYGQYKNVRLTDNEKQKLIDEYGEERTLRAIEYLSEYMQYKVYHVKSHYLAMRKWVFAALHEKAVKEEKLRRDIEKSKPKPNFDSGLDFNLDDIIER